MRDFLTRNLLNDLRYWIISRFGSSEPSDTHKTKTVNLTELISQVMNGELQADTKLRVKCLPSLFGPYQKHHVLSPLIGNHTNMRLGPTIKAQIPFLGFFSQIMSQLTPVGLFPQLTGGCFQGCAYEVGSEAFGFFSPVLPEMVPPIPFLPLLLHERHIQHAGHPSEIECSLRQIDVASLRKAGFSIEDHEALRQLNKLWFLDAGHSDLEVKREGKIAPMWGGLYASGHLLFEGEIKANLVIECFVEAFRSAGFEPKSLRNRVKTQEVLVFARGLRATIYPGKPVIWAIHMDGELGTKYDLYRVKFDRIVDTILRNFVSAFENAKVHLLNPNELDFTYTNSESAYKILQSPSAKDIVDPIAVSIRNWHRTRYSSNAEESILIKSSTNQRVIEVSQGSSEESLHADVGIISIRQDELEAVRTRLTEYGSKQPQWSTLRGYSRFEIPDSNGNTLTVALTRPLDQGHGQAQQVTDKLIRELDPSWILLVGIAGGAPENEFTLGDVLLAHAFFDFAVSAALEGNLTKYRASGGSTHPAVREVLTEVMVNDLSVDWLDDVLMPEADTQWPRGRPPISLEKDRFYGEPDWQKRVIERLEYNLPKEGKERLPKFINGVCASGNELVKNTALLKKWQEFAKQIDHAEMEYPGVWTAAQRSPNPYPVIGIRGISDIVGYERDPRWTEYACFSAASFCVALLRSGLLSQRALEKRGHSSRG